MDTKNLIATGLSDLQAKAYLLLLEEGEITPPKLAGRLNISRTNAYKVLDKLSELRLAVRSDSDKKISFEPGNPLALSNLAAEQRNLATAQEEAVKSVLSSLMTQFYSHSEQPLASVVSGKEAVIDAYRQQINQLEPIYFIRSRSDIVSMGFDTMHDIRITPSRHGIKRHGITPDITTTPINPQSDERSNLDRTWMKLEDYDAPVEWSISGSTLLIVVFGNEPHAVTIANPLIAGAFKQLWRLLNNCLKSMDYYGELPRINKIEEKS